MTEQWDYLFALGREIEQEVAAGATVDVEKAWRLARTALRSTRTRAAANSGSARQRQQSGRIVILPRR
jgi:hypothetical protein